MKYLLIIILIHGPIDSIRVAHFETMKECLTAQKALVILPHNSAQFAVPACVTAGSKGI